MPSWGRSPSPRPRPGPTIATPAPITSVAELTPLTSFGGDIVRIKAGPGGVFGNGLYAISRGAGGNASAVNRPGVIYRVDPATGKASVFFDLNTVMNQIDPNALSTDGKNPAANSLGASTGYVNWYDIAFDPEGYFDGKPVDVRQHRRSLRPRQERHLQDRSRAAQFLGAFVTFTDGLAATKFNVNPTGMVIPGPEDQAFLRGLIAGSGISTTSGTFAALFFNSNAYSPGQIISNGTLPKGVSSTGMTLGTIVGMTAVERRLLLAGLLGVHRLRHARRRRDSRTAGASGVQGSNGELLIGLLIPSTTTSLTLDQTGAVSSQLRRLQDISFDQYGYFSQNVGLTTDHRGGRDGQGGGTGAAATNLFTVVVPPTYAGSLFVSDLATGLSVTVTSVAEGADIPRGGPRSWCRFKALDRWGSRSPDPTLPYDPVTNPLVPITTNGNTTGGTNLGGRIVRITPDGVVNTFAEGFNTSGTRTPRPSSIPSCRSPSRPTARPSMPRTTTASGSSRRPPAWPVRRAEP